ncbi:hypothetical protein ACFSVM_01485 [Paenibacillus shunpengii]|uniref:Uncharacterized protein n=1 Tax=Paenibacillus shunpengii TaxID=2054424 RepID=A0ABW5SHZ3_9BACL|nr:MULTISPECIES: hypothetical protein [unclassified Paenibacillus]OMC72156.1 hypothetical protein BK126_09155 [Paenibacillus sp. FSL H7-0326]SDX46423.1 hypothetical protein SAMN05518848_107290 [Paenibacillus sp. PDC88]
MYLPTIKSRLRYVGVVASVLAICYYLFLYKSTTSAIVTLQSIDDHTIQVLMGDSITRVDIKTHEMVRNLLIEGNYYYIGFTNHPLWGSKLIKIEPSL